MKVCDICNKPLDHMAVDGRTKMGSWAWMCPTCYAKHGVGLGIGKGQSYQFKAGIGYTQVAGGSASGMLMIEDNDTSTETTK